jgi:colanic acid/amylovoran biosynthesis protein
MISNERHLVIGLLWHSFSSDNLGVGALSESQVAICKSAAAHVGVDIRFIVFGTNGKRNYTPADSAIEMGSPISFRELVTGKSAFLKELERCDLVLDIGEGDSFSDIYGMRRFRLQIATKLAVLAKRVPLILSPQTIGPFEKWYSRLLAKWIMRRCEKVYARDGISYQYLLELGVSKQKVSEVTDVAFRLPYRKPETSATGKCRIGINVSGLLYSGGYTGNNQFGLSIDYPQFVRDLLIELCADDENEVWLIPHVLAEGVPRDDDRAAIVQLALEFPRALKAPDFKSPSDAKSFIATMDFMTGARMHACIAAFSAGIPVIPFAYSRKFNGLFESLNYQWLVDGKAMRSEEARNRILEGIARRHELAHHIVSSLSIANIRLSSYERDLNLQMSSIANARTEPPSRHEDVR